MPKGTSDPIEQRDVDKLMSMLLMPEVKNVLQNIIDSEIAKLMDIKKQGKSQKN
mgnify:CR=1 FL=1